MSTLTITTVQTNLLWEDKTANLAMLRKKIEAIEEKTEIVILPEMFSTGFSMHPEKLAEEMDGETIQWMKEICREKKIILTGSLIMQEGGKYFNRLVWMQPDGVYGVYDKRHLFAYSGEDVKYSPGNKRLIASVKGWKINLLVCYDLRFPVWSRQQPDEENKNPEFDLLIYTANWPEKRNHAWKTLLQARAIENQCFVAGVNRVGNDGQGNYHSGDTMIVDPMGTVLYHKEHGEEVFTFRLQKDRLETIRNTLPFLKDADQFRINN